MDKLRGIVAKVFIIGLFSLLILSFAVWGIGDIFRAQTSQPNVAEVGGQEITQEAFRRAFAREYNRLRQRFGGQLDVETARQFGLDQQVLQSLITQALIAEQAEELNLTVTDDQVRQRIFANEAFRNSVGDFDRVRYEQTLRLSGLSEQDFVASLRDEVKRQQLISALTGAIEAPGALARRLYAYNAEKRVADYLTVEQAALEVPADPDESELRRYYEDNTDRYMAPEYRAVSYLHLQPTALYPEIEIDEAALREAYETRRDEFVEPERRAVRHLLFDTEAAARDAAARLAEGRTLDSVAEAATGSPPIDLGLVTREGLPEALAETAFSLPMGATSDPIETDFGWHLLEVTEIQPAKEPSFEDLRETLREDLRRRQAVGELVSIANQLDDELAAGATLEEAAAKLSFAVSRIEALDEQGRNAAGELIAELPDREAFLRSAFTLEPGNESLLRETAAGGYYLLRVDGVTPPKPRPFEEVRETVLADWQASQRETLAFERADALAERLRGGETLETIAAEEGLAVASTGPLTRTAATPSPALASALFTLDPGEVSVVEGPTGPFVAVLREIQAAEPQADDEAVAALRDQVESALAQDMAQRYLTTLQSRYGVSVNPQRVNETLAFF